MKINVASKNPVKVSAVKESILDYNIFQEAEVIPFVVNSDVSDQPKSLKETIKGATNRAKKAFDKCDYSFGIEGGLIKVPNTKTGYMDVCACAIYDGKNCHLGLSSAFEYPKEVVKLIFNEKIEADKAFLKSGITTNNDLGSAEGAIGLLSKGRLNRKELIKQAILTALIHLENPNLF